MSEKNEERVADLSDFARDVAHPAPVCPAYRDVVFVQGFSVDADRYIDLLKPHDAPFEKVV